MRTRKEIPPPDPCPFRVGGRYQVTRSFVALRDEFREGETLTFVRDAYSPYHGVTGYFFRDAEGRDRAFDVYDQSSEGGPPEWNAFVPLPSSESPRQ